MLGTLNNEVSQERPAAQPMLGGCAPEEIRVQLERMLGSKLFRGSRRLSRFLRFTVEQTLKAETDRLKEYCIGLEVFEKPESFDPRMDSIVRVMARRLRLLVNAYYDTDGKEDTLEIHFESGSYVPTFGRRVPGQARTDGKATENGVLLVGGDMAFLENLMSLLGADSSAQGVRAEAAVASSEGGMIRNAADTAATSVGLMAASLPGATSNDAVGRQMGVMALYLSPEHCNEVVQTLKNAQGSEYVVKPIDAQQVSQALRAALSPKTEGQ